MSVLATRVPVRDGMGAVVVSAAKEGVRIGLLSRHPFDRENLMKVHSTTFSAEEWQALRGAIDEMVRYRQEMIDTGEAPWLRT